MPIKFAGASGLLLSLIVALPFAGESAGSPRDPPLSANPSLAVIARAPDFVLRDASGDAVRLSSYRGRVVLLSFVFTTCSAACPIITQQMAMLQQALKEASLFGSRVVLLSVTVDPLNDTAQVLDRYAKTFGADPAGWRFLREEPARLEPVLKRYDEWTKRLMKGDLDHPARIFLIDMTGSMREIYSLAYFNEKQALVDIKALLDHAVNRTPAAR